MIRDLKSIIKRVIRFLVRLTVSELRLDTSFTSRILPSNTSKVKDGYHYFVGYYDIDPVNIDGKILCHRVSDQYTVDIMPEVGVIGLIDLKTGAFEELVTTKAINWQLGSRAQWFDEKNIIFNDLRNGIQISCIFNLECRNVTRFYDRPFWSISPNKKFGVSLNFSRIREKRPGYGYRGDSLDNNDEIFSIFSLEHGNTEYIKSLAEILKEIGCEDQLDDPYLNHIAWSECSSKLLTMFHVQETANNPRKIFPLVFDLQSLTWALIDESGIISHCVWIDEKTILAYKLEQGEYCFCAYSEDCSWRKIKNSLPNSDGHATPFKNRKDILVDGYPNLFGILPLYLGSLDRNVKLKNIAKIINPFGYEGALRCDLHPRLSSDNEMIVCDMPTNSGRRILIVE